MKKIYLLVTMLALSAVGFAQTTDLMISEYIEGSSNNKALEIYNGTGADVDLSAYQIWKISNGGSWPENTLSLSGTLANGDVYVIYNSSADPAIAAVGDITWGSANWNGDDAVGLAKDDGTGTFVLIDAVGEDGADPGSGWDVAGVANATKDHTLVKKETVCSPNTNWDASRGTNATDSEWIVYNQDEFSYLGSHTSSCGGGTGPDNPTNLLATTISTSEIDLSWTRNSDLDSVMVVWSPDQLIGTPADGTYYAVGDTIPGGDSVIYRGIDTTYAHTALASGTMYFYQAFSLNSSSSYSSGVGDYATTYKDEPSNHVAFFAAGTPTASSIPLTWGDNDGAVVADSFLIMVNTTGTFTAPVDGTPQAEDLDVSDGAGVVHVAHGDQAYTWSSLSQSTHYYFTIYPYTNSGSAINYKTGATVPTADATTTGFTTTLPYSQTFDADLGDCEQYSVSGSSKYWGWNSTDQSAQMNGYNSGDIEEDWLFIPGIDFDSYSNEFMTFDLRYKYGTDDADNYMKLMYSSDYPGTGDPSGYTWDTLAFSRPAASDTWASSGTVDLSAISGTSVYIAFKYRYNSGSYRRWDVDNISIEESTTNPEPTNYPTAFTASADHATAITNTWTDATGTQLPDGYVVYVNLTGTFTAPVDGTPVLDDTDISDGSGVVNVAYSTETYQWTGLTPSTQYYFTIYSFTNSGSAIDYKTDGTPPVANTSTPAANTDLIISEVADPGDDADARFVELYNLSTDSIFLDVDDWYLTKQVNGGTYYDVHLTGDTILPGETYVVAASSSSFSSAYGFIPDKANGNINGNGDDGYYLFFGGDHSGGILIDAYGVQGFDGTGMDWEYSDSKAVRKRSVGSPNSTWTASEWVISDADTVNMTPGQHLNYVTWQGTTDNNWDTKTNWDNGFIPDVSMNITIGSGTNNPEFSDADAVCWDMNFAIGGNLTIKPGGVLTVYNDIAGAKAGRALYSLTIESEGSGQGALIVKGSASVKAKVENFITAGKWHGISSPVSGMTANNLYLNGNPDVWMKYYNENDNTYSYITDLSTSLGDMKGWMVWVDSTGGLSDTTFTFENNLRSGTQSPSESIVRSQPGDDYGFNFVGNPFTSTIDWDDTTGWTKTNLNDAIYVYNDTSFASYVGGSSVNGGSRYIAMNQGFFVQVTNDGSTTGALQATSDVCVAHSAVFRKSSRADFDYSLVRLEIVADGVTDETVVKLKDGATNGFDGSYDAYKMFSFNTNYPQIYSTANGGMSINTVPVETGFVNLDVKGKEGDLMTISATERTNLNEVWLVDELTGIETDLTKDSYSFTYDNTVTNRFTLHFSIVSIGEQQTSDNLFSIYAADNAVNVMIPSETRASVEIYNLLGQKVAAAYHRTGLNRFSLKKNSYYVVKVYNAQKTETQKVIIQ